MSAIRRPDLAYMVQRFPRISSFLEPQDVSNLSAALSDTYKPTKPAAANPKPWDLSVQANLEREQAAWKAAWDSHKQAHKVPTGEWGQFHYAVSRGVDWGFIPRPQFPTAFPDSLDGRRVTYVPTRHN